MNTPNPLVPQGSLLEQHKSKGKSNFFIAVFTILAIHVILFAGLLMQGCRRAKPESPAAETTLTNQVPVEAAATTNPPVPPPPTNMYSVYTGNLSNQPAVTPAPLAAPPSNIAQTPGPLPADLPVEVKQYTVARGDAPYKIAKAHGISLNALVKANPNMDARKLKVGQTLQIPAAPAKAEANAGALGAGLGAPGVTEVAAPAQTATKTYTVKPGDTLTKVAKQHGTTAKALQTQNKLKSTKLLAGQKLKVPAAKSANPPAEPMPAAPTGVTTPPPPAAAAGVPANRM